MAAVFLLLLIAVLLLLLVLLLRGLGEVAASGRTECEDGAGDGSDDSNLRVPHNWTIRATPTIRHATRGTEVSAELTVMGQRPGLRNREVVVVELHMRGDGLRGHRR